MLNINAATAILYESFRLFRNEIKKKSTDVLDFAAVNHPGVPSEILDNKYVTPLNLNSVNLLNVFTKVKEPEPQNVLSPLAARYFSKVLNKEVSPEEIAISKSSSTAFLDAIVHLAVSIQRNRGSMLDFIMNNSADQSKIYDTQTVILAPRGSFKCGALSPLSNSCLFYLVDTKIDNKFKLQASELKETIKKLILSNFKIGAFIFEAPTALGQCYEEEEIKQIAGALDEFPKLLIIQDCYQLFTEHNKQSNFMLHNYLKDKSRVITISSFRRKYGLAAQIMGISLLHTSNRALLEHIMNRLLYLDRYPEKPVSFTEGQLRLTTHTFEQMLESDFPYIYCDIFKEFSAIFEQEVSETNDIINTRLKTNNKRYIYTLHPQAGQFGFLFLESSTAQKAKITSGLQFGELLAISPECNILVTLLDPMGINNPIGVRFNLLTSENNKKNIFLIKEALKGLANLIVNIENNKIDYNFYKPQIELLYTMANGS